MKYKKIVGVTVCTVCISLSLHSISDAATISSTIDKKTAGVESILETKKSVNEILKSAGAAKVLEDNQEKTLWGYKTLGIANVEGNLNVRAIAAEDGKIVGKLSGDGACEIIGFKDSWAHIKSGKVEGYVAEEYLLMGKRQRLEPRKSLRRWRLLQQIH